MGPTPKGCQSVKRANVDEAENATLSPHYFGNSGENEGTQGKLDLAVFPGKPVFCLKTRE
jgi:hypothetical protein